MITLTSSVREQGDFVVETDALTKRHGAVLAVDELSLLVTRGGVFGLLGANGSGKTTTMGMLLGLVGWRSGDARIFGEPAVRPQALKRIGAMVESPRFCPYLPGRANFRYFEVIDQDQALASSQCRCSAAVRASIRRTSR